ncbi:MAG TPA: hypothetical protein VJV78_35645 [Polyangiales bacterium]|nr:hypothetical protein [Polyangiales bacterium]
MGFELRFSVDYHTASRDDFSRPIFLIAQPLEQLTAHQLTVRADLRLSITPRLALQISLPWAWRGLDGRTSGLVISGDQALAGIDFSLSGSGVGDPLLGLAYRFWTKRPWRAWADLGATIPIDDNPDSSIFPRRVPIGTGQHMLFVGAGVSLEQPIPISLAYRFGYSPGEHATYLVRRTAAQSFTSGALGPYIRQRISAAASVPLFSVLSLWLMPEWLINEQPLLVERGGSRMVQYESWTHELNLQLALRVQLGPHRLELHGSLPVLGSWDADPFFPITIPERGVGVTWQLVGS